MTMDAIRLSPGFVVVGSTRAQALADGVLMDLAAIAFASPLFPFPIACTADVWAMAVDVPVSGMEARAYQAHRARHLLMTAYAAAVAKLGTAHAGVHHADPLRVDFTVDVRVPSPGEIDASRAIDLYPRVGAGDAGEPVATIMLAEED